MIFIHSLCRETNLCKCIYMNRNLHLFTWAFAALFASATDALADVTINEVMPCNISSYMDKDLFNFSPYVEFYNNGTTSVDLKGYKIVHEKRTSKNVYDLKWEWTISESVSVPASGYKLIFFDKVERAGHSLYKLDTDGGNLFLYDTKGNLVNSLTYPPMYTHISYGPEGFMEPTPLAANSDGVENIYYERCEQPTFSGATPGVQTSTGSVTLTSETEGATIYYTTDGTEPNQESTKYTKAISISKNTCIRARAYKEGLISSSILTGSFIFVDSEHTSCGNGFTVPIVSIVVDDDYLNDDSIGICVKGVNGAPITSSCLGSGNANFMQDWDRPVNFEYIVDGKQVLSHEAEVGVMGGCSRGADVKSFKIKAGKKMGYNNEYLDYSFFADKPDNEYKSLHLRNGGNATDETWVRCRDGYMQSLAKVMNIDYQAYQPVAYYINGEYKGLMGLRERTSDDYVETNYGIDADDIDLLKLTNTYGVEATAGTADGYNAMVSYLENNDPTSDTYYEGATKYIDMQEYMDYNIFEQFIVNTDWPGNNCKLWREQENGRFRWILFDTDFGLGLYDATASNYCDVTMNSIEWCTGEGSKFNWANGTKKTSGYSTSYVYDSEAAWKTTIFRHLMQNPTFKEKFLTRNLIHLGTTFTNDRVQAVWDSILALVKHEYCASFDGASLSSNEKAQSMLDFAKKRPSYVYKYLQSYYGLGDLVSLEFSSNISNAYFMMNEELVNMPSFSGNYFKGMALKLEAVAPSGYIFDHWEMGDGDISESLIGNNTKWNYYYHETGFTTTEWTTSSFNDSKWSTGTGRFGYASSNDAYTTVLDYGGDADNKYTTAYFRSTATISDLSNLNKLTIDITYDDAYVLYINGHEVSRANIEDGDIDYSTFSTSYENDAEATIKITPESDAFAYLVEGENTIAVEIHQQSLTSSDMTFELSMDASYAAGAATTYKEPTLNLTINEAKSLKAIFVEQTTCPDLTLYITEICSSNGDDSKVTDEYGNHSDWFEVYNYGEKTINMAGLFMTDKESKPQKSQIPYGYEETKIEPGEYKVFWADGKSFRGPNHVDFKLSNTSDASFLMMYRSCDLDNPLEFVVYQPMTTNSSYGLADVSDHDGEWKIYGAECEYGQMYMPTPGEENGTLSSTEGCTEGGSVEVNETLSNTIALYPNPAVDQLNISLSGDDVHEMAITIYDNLGRTVLQRVTSSNKTSVDVDSWASGLYHLRIVADNAIYEGSFVKR